MSAQASAWAWEVHLEPQVDAQGTVSEGAQRFVLVCIADHAWPDGSHAWPGVERLASRCSMSERQVQRCLHALVAQGRLVVEREPTNRLPTMYALPVDNYPLGVKHLHSRGEAPSSRGEAPSPKPIVNPGSLEDAISAPDLGDNCGCRYDAGRWHRCDEHGGGLTDDDRERIMQSSIPPSKKEPLL